MLRENIPRPSAMTLSGRRGCAAIVAGSGWQGKYPVRQSDAPGSAKNVLVGIVSHLWWANPLPGVARWSSWGRRQHITRLSKVEHTSAEWKPWSCSQRSAAQWCSRASVSWGHWTGTPNERFT